MNHLSSLIAANIAELPALPTARRVFRCEKCGCEIERNTWACDACVREHCSELRSRKLASARASVPEKHRAARFGSVVLADYVQLSAKQVEAVRRLPLRPIVVVHGPAGSGKTTLACAMLHSVIEAGANLACSPDTFEQAKKARFAECYALSVARSEHGLGRDTPPEVAEAVAASVLVLDELGREDSRNRDVEHVISTRYRENRPTIITTWLTPDGLRGRYDEGIYRRLCEGSVIIPIGGVRP